MACVATTTAASRVFFCSNRKPFFFLCINPSIRFIGCSNNHIVSCLKTPKNDSSSSIRCIQSAQDTLETTRNEGISSVCGLNVVDILEERGLIESITSENLRLACSKPKVSPLKIYCGFDPIAESLHLENLLGIIVLSWFQRCGHKAVALIRPELDIETLENNTVGIVNTITGILGRKTSISTIGNEKIQTTDMGLCDSFVILNNFDWWKDISLLDFLRNVGRFARNEGVNVQIGGSDQWGNITAGTELIWKILQVEGAYGLTFPLLLKSDGTKFGKSEDGAIWLSPSMLSPYKFYQYFFSVLDVDVVRFLKILIFLSMEEIRELEEQMKKSGYVPNSAQRRLAEEVTRFVHGEEGLLEALKDAEALRPGAETKLDWKTIEEIAGDVPSCSLASNQVLNASLVDLSVSTGLFESKSAARRLLKQGGLYLNKNRVDNEGKKIEAVDIVDGKELLLSAGKKNKMIIRIP
ncbi:tyrosine--tRNA ligase, chloroplastic/mitochondrial-like [Macadamia integrifolia]|uniref:tyrosine--tRNA ligase, chloroplastic/mitochondrial-like n=1 Tax=Macadamia integrifolia TaxID=60698 RepID=UPI001C52DD69|nr:tyrosine--tRNA ligase, chloroplastic/mitochondrial-like [Macadamia integrifolia]